MKSVSFHSACRAILRWKPAFSLVLFLLAMPFITGQADAQSSASLNGTASDTTGAVVPGVSITLTNVDTGVSRGIETNNAGLYRFVSILPGRYTLQAARSGFETVVQPQIQLQVNQTATVNFKLPIGATATKVEISAESIHLETSTAELGTVVGDQQVVNLPLNGRNFTELLLLTPGASAANPLQNAGGPGGAIGSFVYPSVNGQPNRSNMFLLDGVVNYNGSNDTNAIQPTIDDIDQFKVQSHNDEAEYGQVLGGIVNVVTKSGTNSFHGALWEFLRNDAFDASNYFSTSAKTPLRQNQFGGAAGGPVLLPGYNGRDHTFFYGSYEGYRQRTASSQLYLVPTAAQLAGDFSAIPSHIYNPYSAAQQPDGSYVNSPFLCGANGTPSPVNASNVQTAGTPCNMIPSALINSTMLTYMKTLFPAPKDVGVPGFNGQNNSAVSTNSNQYSARIDEQLGQNNRIFGRYTGAWFNNTSPDGQVYGNNGTATYNTYNIAAKWTHEFGSSALVELTFGRVNQSYTTNTETPDPATFLKTVDFAPNFYSHGSGPRIPTVQLLGYNLYGDFTSQGAATDIYQYGGDGSKLIGRHLLKFGASLSTDNVRGNFDGSVDVFGTTQTSNGSAGLGGDSAASALLGIPTYAELDNGGQDLQDGKIYGLYFEDQWQVNRRLSLNLGVRYDVTNWPVIANSAKYGSSSYIGNMNLNNGTYELQNRPSACSATQSAPCIPGGTLPARVDVSSNGKIFQNTYDNIQPRLGLAYKVDSNTVFHAGYGRFFDNWASVIGFGANFGNSWPDVTYLEGDNLNNPTVRVFANDPLQIGSGPIAPAANPFEQSDGFLDPKLKNSYADQYNAGFQRQFGQSTVVSLNYVGAKDRRAPLQLSGNAALTPGPGDPQQRAPYPYILAQKGYVRSIGASNYNALQVSSQGRTRNGLTYSVAYTWSKTIDFGCDTYGHNCDVQDPYHWQKDKGVAGWDLTNIFSGSMVYPLPFGRGKQFYTGNPIADTIIGGWQLNGILSLSSGLPYDIQGPYQIANTNNVSGVVRANVVGDPRSGATKLNPINVNAFALPAQYTFGDLGRNSLRSDWAKNLDLSVFRSFHIFRESRLEIRGEAFNLTNTPVFAAPDNQLTDPTFGAVSSTANTERELQVAGKFIF